MSSYCALLASWTGFDREQHEQIRTASVMHDVGKIGVPDAVLLKPGRLSAEEFELMKRHAEFGYEILKGTTSPLLDLAAEIAFTHHERWDGGGYPRGLARDEIPVEGRMAAIADVFDALTSDRVYRKAFTIPQAIEMIKDERGAQFDPDLLDLFLDGFPEVLRVKETVDQGRAGFT
jgi:putative two-component system response regulator